MNKNKVLDAIKMKRLIIHYAEKELLVLIAYKRLLDGYRSRFQFESNILSGGRSRWYTSRIKDDTLFVDFALKGNNYITVPVSKVDALIKEVGG